MPFNMKENFKPTRFFVGIGKYSGLWVYHEPLDAYVLLCEAMHVGQEYVEEYLDSGMSCRQKIDPDTHYLYDYKEDKQAYSDKAFPVDNDYSQILHFDNFRDAFIEFAYHEGCNLNYSLSVDELISLKDFENPNSTCKLYRNDKLSNDEMDELPPSVLESYIRNLANQYKISLTPLNNECRIYYEKQNNTNTGMDYMEILDEDYAKYSMTNSELYKTIWEDRGYDEIIELKNNSNYNL